jgi:two-component system, chemotaxis family, protein-glutamate methylesterase/glutaminase
MPVRVLLVEDSLTVRCLLRETLQPPEFEVVGEAHDGQQAIELCRTKRPDVITMDMLLPVMSGLAATEYIMAHFPTPILIVSSSFNRGELFKTYDALAAGAVDTFEKPTGDEDESQWREGFLSALRIVARVRVITHPRGKRTRETPIAPRPILHHVSLVAFGGSTGGPGALVRVLNAIPQDFKLPIVAVIHLSVPFARAFIEWLAQQTSRDVTYAVDGASLADMGGRVVLAPPNYHLRIVSGRFQLSQDAEVHSCRPSVDVLFESLANGNAQHVTACLLTGMGKDGARGLLQLKQAGALTIAQNESSCVVYGMPREAALLGAASRVLSLEEIAEDISALVRTKGGPQ